MSVFEFSSPCFHFVFLRFRCSNRSDLEGAVRAVRNSKAVGGVGRPKNKSVSSKGKKPAHKRSAVQRERCPKAEVDALSAAEANDESVLGDGSEAAEPSIDGESSLGWVDAEAGMDNTENEDEGVIVGVDNDVPSFGGCRRYSWRDDDLPGEVNRNR